VAPCNSRCSISANMALHHIARRPGERLVVCATPNLAAERARKRADLLAATETDLAAIKARVGRKRRSAARTAAIALAVGEVLKHPQNETAFRPDDH